jgi:hypothetical protein
MKIVRRFILIFFYVSASAPLFAQFGAQVNMFVPVKDMSYLLKPGPGIEVHARSGTIESFFKMGGSIGFATFKPTQDTFRVYAVQEGSGNKLLPGYQVITSYQMYSLGISLDFKLFKEEKKFSPVLGMDGFCYIVNYSEDYRIETSTEGSTQNENTWVLAIAPKAGLTYAFRESWLFSLTLARSMGYGPGGIQSYWKPSVGFTYYFD